MGKVKLGDTERICMQSLKSPVPIPMGITIMIHSLTPINRYIKIYKFLDPFIMLAGHTTLLHMVFTTLVVQWLSCLFRIQQIVGSSPGWVKPKTIKLVFAASPLSMQRHVYHLTVVSVSQHNKDPIKGLSMKKTCKPVRK